MKRGIFVWLTLFLVVNQLDAQHTSYNWFAGTQGFPDQSVPQITQDDMGNILFGSEHGLVVYDGKNFSKKTKADGLPSIGVHYFNKSHTGTVWIMCMSGKICYLKNGKISSVESFNTVDRQNVYESRIYPISDEEFIICYFRPYAYFHYKKEGKEWKKMDEGSSSHRNYVLRSPKNYKDSIGILDVSEYGKNKSTIFHIKQRQYFYSTSKTPGRFRFYFVGERVFVSSDNDLIEYTDDGALLRKKMDHNIENVCRGNNNTLWVCFSDGGIRHINTSTFEDIGETLLPEYKIASFLEDLEGGRWFCTEKGIAYQPYSRSEKMEVKDFFLSPLNTTLFVHDTLFIGHANGNVGYIVPGKMEREELIFESPYVNTYWESYVRDFAVDQKGNLLFVNFMSGLYALNRKTFAVECLDKFGGSDIASTDHGVYVSRFERGVSKIDRLGKEEFTIPTEGKRPLSVSEIYPISENHFLLGSADGLWEMKDSVVKFKGNHYGLEESITCFVKLSDTNMAIGTYGNGIVLCSKTDTITIDVNEGLISNFVNDMILDADGTLWVVTDNGISMITYKNVERFEINNIPGYEMLNYHGFYVQEHNKKIYITSPDGISIFPVKCMAQATLNNPLNLHHVNCNGTELPLDSIKITFSKQNVLNINYRRNNFNKSAHVLYFYRLKNYSDKWESTSNESVSYRSLSPGNYQFEIYSKLSSQKEGNGYKTIHIQVLPRFWQTWWFSVVVLIMVATLLYFLFLMRLRRVKNKQRVALEAEILLAKSQAKALRSQMNPHFTFNAINSIQHFILKNDAESAHYYLGKFSKLVRTILEMSKYDTITIERELLFIKDYLDLEQLRSNHRFEYAVNVDDMLIHQQTEMPSMLIQPIVENAVIHGVNPFHDRKGMITIDVKQQDGYLICMITDNGVGRKKSAEIKARKAQYHESMAHSILEERLVIFNTMNELKAKVITIDLYDNNGQPLGTQVELWIPILKYTENKQ